MKQGSRVDAKKGHLMREKGGGVWNSCSHPCMPPLQASAGAAGSLDGQPGQPACRRHAAESSGQPSIVGYISTLCTSLPTLPRLATHYPALLGASGAQVASIACNTKSGVGVVLARMKACPPSTRCHPAPHDSACLAALVHLGPRLCQHPPLSRPRFMRLICACSSSLSRQQQTAPEPGSSPAESISNSAKPRSVPLAVTAACSGKRACC